jgi:hypothetical protein
MIEPADMSGDHVGKGARCTPEQEHRRPRVTPPATIRLIAPNQSRLITEAETARILRMTPCSFSRKAAQLENELGMPRRHPLLKRRDRVAIHRWLDSLFSVDRKPAKRARQETDGGIDRWVECASGIIVSARVGATGSPPPG